MYSHWFLHNIRFVLSRDHVTTRVTVGVVVGWQGRLWKTLEGPGMIVCHWAYRGLRPINTAYLPTVDPVL